jgi:sugar O-acyltransferase (sialic acid O-acetyltransferase NeuD family)
MTRTLWILGSSGHAREVEAIARASDVGRHQWGKMRFIDAADEIALHAAGGDAVLGMGSPRVRRRVSERCPSNVNWPTIIHPEAHLGPRVDLAHGVVVAMATTVTVDVEIGTGTMLNTAVAVGHDVHIGKYCLVNPHATISGNVVLGDETLIGAGAIVLEGRHVGDGAVVGAGAVVTKDVPPGFTVVGVPAREIVREKD